MESRSSHIVNGLVLACLQGVLSAKIPDLPRSNYAIHIADTVLVGAWGEFPQNLTAPAPIGWGNVSYSHKVRAQEVTHKYVFVSHATSHITAK